MGRSRPCRDRNRLATRRTDTGNGKPFFEGSVGIVVELGSEADVVPDHDAHRDGLLCFAVIVYGPGETNGEFCGLSRREHPAGPVSDIHFSEASSGRYVAPGRVAEREIGRALHVGIFVLIRATHGVLWMAL